MYVQLYGSGKVTFVVTPEWVLVFLEVLSFGLTGGEFEIPFNKAH